MAKKKQKTVDEILEQNRQDRFSRFTVGDDKEHHSVDEVLEAGYSQGLFERPKPTVAPSGNIIGRQSPMQRNNGFLNLEDQIRKTENETIPRIAKEAYADYQRNKVGYDYLSRYNDETHYSDVSGDIAKLEELKGGAARRNKDTAAYDKAIEMLKSYADQRYSLGDDETSYSDKLALYDENKKKISKYENGADDSGISSDEYENALKDNKAFERVGLAEAQAKELSLKDDFAEKSAAAEYNTPKTKDDVNDYYLNKSEKSASPTFRINVLDAYDMNELPDKLGSFLSSEGIKNQYSFVSAEKKLSNDMAAGGITKALNPTPYTKLTYEGYSKGWDTISDAEKGAYYYIYNTKGKEAAYEYLDNLTDTLQKRRNYEYKKDEMSDSADEGTVTNLDWILRNAASVPDNIAGGAAGFLENQSRMLSGQELQPYNPAHGASLSADATREAAGESLDEEFGRSDKWYPVNPSDIYGGVMSTADMAAALLTGEAAYSAAMGAGAAEKTARDLWEQGEDNDTINTVSTAAGIAEVFFEKFSAENLWKAFDYAGTKGGSKLVLKWLHNMARQGLVEASEETLTEAANMIVDYAVRGDRSDVKSWEDVGTRLYKSAVGGAIGGLLGGGMATTAGAVTQGSNIHQYHNYEKQYEKQAGQGIVSNANVEALIEKARQTGDEALVAQADALDNLYQSDNVSEKKLEKEAGKLYASVQESTIKNVDEATAKRAEIKRAFAEQLRGNEAVTDVEKASEALTKDYFSDKLTRSEKAIVATGAAQEAKAAVKENEDILTEQAQKSQQRAYENYIDTYALTQAQEKPKESAIDTSDYHQSADGATYYDGEFVNVKDIASVGADSVTVNLDNGKTADVKKMDLSSEDDAVIYQSIVDIQKSLGQPIPRELANEIYHGYDSDVYQNATDYILGVRDAIEKGYSNETLMRADDPAAVLAPAAREEFYRAGRNIALGNTAQRQSNVTAQPSATGKGSVTFEGGDIKKVLPRLNGRRRVAVDLMTGLAEAKGLDVVFFESKKDGKGRWNSKYANAQTGDTGAQSPNGFYKNGKIYIDINSGTNGQGLILFTASHELVHMIREYSPEMYQELADFLVEKYNKKGISVRTLVLREMAKSTNLNYDEALEEVIANSCESFLRDVHLNDKAAELYRSKPTLANKIRDYLHDLLSRLKKWYAGLTPQSVEGRTVAAMRDETQHAHDLFVKGINQASENRLNAKKAATEDGARYDLREYSDNSENINREFADSDTKFSIREEAPPKNTVVGYKVFRVKDGKLYPPMVANPGGADTPVGVWLNADVGERAPDSKTGRAQVKGKGGMSLSFRPGWHLGDVPRASQFDRKNPVTGKKDMFPSDFVWAECDCAADVDYQDEAMSYGYTENGKFRHAYAGLPRVPENGYYKYRTNPRPDTVPWIITGAIKVNRILSDSEVADILESKGITPPQRQGGNKTLEELGLSNDHVKRQYRSDADYLSAVERGDMETAQKMVDQAAKAAGYTIKAYHGTEKSFTVFEHGHNRKEYPVGKNMGEGHYFSSDKSQAEIYANGRKNGVLSSYLSLKNPYKLYGTQFDRSDLQVLSKNAGREITKLNVGDYLQDQGYDGVINLDYSGDVRAYLVYDSSQIKSAEPVTYDDNGNVIPLSERFNTEKNDIRYQSRNEDFDLDFLFDDDDSIENTFAKEYATHHEDIGEVLRNISDIDIAPKKVAAIVNRVLRDNLGSVNAKARELLSTELQIALDRVSRENPEMIVNEMIDAVRTAVSDVDVTDDRAAANYSDLLSAFKGRKFYLTDEQISQLAEHDMTLNDFRKKMFGYGITIVSRENAKRSIDGGYADATELSLEGLYDMLESPEEFLPFRREQWDEYGYDAPYILTETLDNLRDMRTRPLDEAYSGEYVDDMAVALTAKITGAIVEAKYNSKQNPYVTKLVDDLKQKRTEAVKKQKEKNRQKLADLRQKERARAEKREQEIRQNYREQRDRNRESRKRTEFRDKIKRIADSFNKRLTAPKSKQYIPQEFIEQTLDVLNSVAFKGKRGVAISSTIADLRQQYNELHDSEYYSAYTIVVEKRLSIIGSQVKQEAKEWVPKRNKAIAQENNRLKKQGKPLKPFVTEADFNVNNMSLELLDLVYKCFKSMDYVIRESVKMTDTKFKQDAHQLGREMIAETKAVPKEHVGLLSGYIQTQLRPDVLFNRLAGFKKNSTWSQMARMLNDGQLHMTQLQMEFSKIFADVLTDTKQLRTLSDTKHLVDIGLVDDDGNKVPITRGMMLSLYMHLQNEDNVRHVMGGGLTVPSMKEYYNGDLTKAFGSGQRSVRVGAIDFSQYAEGIKTVIEKQLTDYENLWIGYAHEFFDVASREAINDTTMKLYHFKKANVDNYFPIHTDSNYRAASFESITRDMSLENSGFMKERIKASNPILLEDIVDVINDQIQKVSKYCGLTIPIKNFQKVYGTTLAGFETSLQKEINKKFSGSRSNTSATKYIDNLITDLTSGRQTSDGPFAKFFSMARGNLAAATLTLNVRVAIAQAASYPTAAAEIGWKPLLKAFVKGGKNNRMISGADRAYIEEHTPLLWLRTQGYSNTEIGDIKEIRKQRHQIEGKFKKALGWIEFFDGMTVGRLFYAAQYYVDEQFPTLKRGSEEYKQKVAEVYNDVIEKTQPNYTTMQRPDILRNPNALVKSMTMFMTQRLQNFNILYDAVGTYNKYRKDLKAGVNGVTSQDLREAKTKLRRAVVSQTVASVTIVGMKLFADMLMHSMNGYRDDDDELTTESVWLALMNNFADAIFGSVLFGSDLYSLLKSAIIGERYYGISLSGVDSFTDALEKIVNLRKGINLDSANKAATAICQLMGIPLNNAEKIGKAIYNWGSDFSAGSFMESGVERTNKQNIHRAETRFSGGDTAGAQELLNAMIEQKKAEGKTDKEAKSWLRSQMTSTYKPRYVQAVKDNNTEERTAIRQFLYQSGAYGSLTDLDKALSKWLDK